MNTGVHRRRIGKPAAAGGSFILDALPATVWAYSSRKLITGAATPFAIRRSSDGSTSTVDFDVNGDGDQSTLSAFAGANSVTVSQWNDQSGNALHLPQADTSLQPRLVNSGTLDRVNGQLAPYFFNQISPSVIQKYFKYTGAIPDASSFHIFAVMNIAAGALPFRFSRVYAVLNPSAVGVDFANVNAFMLSYQETSAALYAWANNNNSSKSFTTSGRHLLSLKISTSQLICGVDGSNGTTYNTSLANFSALNCIVLGSNESASDAVTGNICEFVAFDGWLNSTDETTYINDVRAYWGTP